MFFLHEENEVLIQVHSNWNREAAMPFSPVFRVIFLKSRHWCFRRFSEQLRHSWDFWGSSANLANLLCFNWSFAAEIGLQLFQVVPLVLGKRWSNMGLRGTACSGKNLWTYVSFWTPSPRHDVRILLVQMIATVWCFILYWFRICSYIYIYDYIWLYMYTNYYNYNIYNIIFTWWR